MEKIKIFDRSNASLEEFDIRNVTGENPNSEVGVNVNRIYIQIAKINGNPRKQKELQILVKALPKEKKYNNIKEPAYVVMNIEDVVICFKRQFKHLPRNTFIKI